LASLEDLNISTTDAILASCILITNPHNILLDHDFCPKISDFGLAKLCPNKESAISIVGARGTIGYIAPEVFSKQFGTVSSKSDVYSYGMMVLEMVGARDKNVNADSETSSQYSHQWIYEHLDDYSVLLRLMVRPQSS
jgi:serine/threonine protein kinase